MINFEKLTKSRSSPALTKLVDLFEQLDRKATHQILRPVQEEALQLLDAQHAEHDVVLKVSTGSGKTLVGLVYAEMMRRKYPGEPVIFLCPTSQLVDQVLDTASKIGVVADAFVKGDTPYQAFEGRTILVCTYDKLFTARNVFDRDNIIPSAIVLDDVHTGIDRIRQKYTVSIPDDPYQRVKDIFRPLGESYDPAIWQGISTRDSGARFEVPYWLWLPQIGAVAEVLEQYSDHEELFFSWPNISRYLEQTRLCISGAGAELSLIVPATEENRAFAGAKHRLFMSASIKDGTALIRDLGCEATSLDRVIEPQSDKGAGERMILPTALIDPMLKRSEIAQFCADLAKTTNVVVLTSSAAQSATWTEAGATHKQGRDVDGAVAILKSASKGNFFTFAQRFDGVDLPDDACRILVIDGTPIGERLCDQIDSERQKNSPANSTRIVNRLEQALGRAVRSSADFAVVLLVGTDIASFIGRRDVKILLEPHTREQIDLGKDIAEQLKVSEANSLEALRKTVSLLLDRDDQWKEAHRERVLSATRSTRGGTGLTVNERAAVLERQAWILAKARNHQAAVASVQRAIDEPELHEIQKAELMFRMAGYMYHFDQAKAASLYRGAFQINSALSRPPQMPDRKYALVRVQAAALRDAIGKFTSTNAAIARVEEVRAKLAYAGNAESVEQGLQELGELLGATSSRPEKETGRGPDVLWLFDGIGFCIEAKSEKQSTIFKADAEQLLLSVEWCVEQVKLQRSDVVPIFVTNSTSVDRQEDVSFRPAIVKESMLIRIVDALSALITGMSFDGPLFSDVTQINERLHMAKITGKEIARQLDRI